VLLRRFYFWQGVGSGAGSGNESAHVNNINSHVRVAVIGCSGLLGDIIRQTIRAEADLEVVAELAVPGTDFNLAEVDADIVLWNDADEYRISRWLADLMQERSPRVLATTTDGQRGALWELKPHRIELGELSPRTLVDTIRRGCAGLS
jgi:chemotaxis response regulator CheB